VLKQKVHSRHGQRWQRRENGQCLRLNACQGIGMAELVKGGAVSALVARKESGKQASVTTRDIASHSASHSARRRPRLHDHDRSRKLRAVHHAVRQAQQLRPQQRAH
jgi:hypothetical protein